MGSTTLLAIATLVATASAGAGSADEIALLSERLENGMLVTICQDPALQLVATQHWIHAGRKQSPKGQKQSAHIVEHLLFAGTERTHLRPASSAPWRACSGIRGGCSRGRTGMHGQAPSTHCSSATNVFGALYAQPEGGLWGTPSK